MYDANTKDGLKRVVTAVNNSKNWVFTAVRTMKPIKRDQLIESLGLEALPDVNGLKVYSVKHDMDSLSNLLIKANRPHSDWQVCLFDGQTLVFADPIPWRSSLPTEANRSSLPYLRRLRRPVVQPFRVVRQRRVDQARRAVRERQGVPRE